MRLAALVCSTAAISALAAGAAGGVSSRVPGRVQVVEKEFSITLSRLRVHSGPVIVEVDNFGMDNHDLVIQGKDPTKTWRFPPLAPETRATKSLNLARGKYTLYCSLPGHRALGMVATLTVVG
jgi:hypothetical protein